MEHRGYERKETPWPSLSSREVLLPSDNKQFGDACHVDVDVAAVIGETSPAAQVSKLSLTSSTSRAARRPAHRHRHEYSPELGKKSPGEDLASVQRQLWKRREAAERIEYMETF